MEPLLISSFIFVYCRHFISRCSKYSEEKMIWQHCTLSEVSTWWGWGAALLGSCRYWTRSQVKLHIPQGSEETMVSPWRRRSKSNEAPVSSRTVEAERAGVSTLLTGRLVTRAFFITFIIVYLSYHHHFSFKTHKNLPRPRRLTHVWLDVINQPSCRAGVQPLYSDTPWRVLLFGSFSFYQSFSHCLGLFSLAFFVYSIYLFSNRHCPITSSSSFSYSTVDAFLQSPFFIECMRTTVIKGRIFRWNLFNVYW